jgi:hypothetical protein
MKKILLAASVLVLLQLGQSKRVENISARFRRNAEHPPVEDEAHIVAKIKEGITHLRHSEARLKAFADHIEEAMKNVTFVKAIHVAHENGIDMDKLDFSRIGAALNSTYHHDHSPKTVRELVKRISEDTHILLDQLHGHLDSTGHHIKAAAQGSQSGEDSVEDGHEEKST